MRYHAYAKTNSIRNRDKAQFGRSDLKLADTIELALRSDGKCAACGCILLFEKFKPRCFYQWSLDRINRDLPHSTGKVRLVCCYCNLGGPGRRKPPCRLGCHPGDLPWGSAPRPAPPPEDLPCPVWERRRVEDAQLAAETWQEAFIKGRVDAVTGVLDG